MSFNQTFQRSLASIPWQRDSVDVNEVSKAVSVAFTNAAVVFEATDGSPEAVDQPTHFGYCESKAVS